MRNSRSGYVLMQWNFYDRGETEKPSVIFRKYRNNNYRVFVLNERGQYKGSWSTASKLALYKAACSQTKPTIEYDAEDSMIFKYFGADIEQLKISDELLDSKTNDNSQT